MPDKSVLDFPEVNDILDDDILYLIRGNGSTRDKKIKRENIVKRLVDILNDQSIDGVKTFIKTPIVPTKAITAMETGAVQGKDVFDYATAPSGTGFADNILAMFSDTTGKLIKSSNLGVETAITDDDSKVPTSGSVVDYVASNGGSISSMVYTSSNITLATMAIGEVRHVVSNVGGRDIKLPSGGSYIALSFYAVTGSSTGWTGATYAGGATLPKGSSSYAIMSEDYKVIQRIS